MLHSRWVLAAAPETVWGLLSAPEDWPRWWRYVRSVQRLQAGGAEGLGARHRFVWGSVLGYGFAFVITTTRVLRPSLLEGRASGDLEGVGTWTLAPQADGTCLGYRWAVALRRPWMRLSAPLLMPLFAWNHHAVMRAGAQGMANRLGCVLRGYRALPVAAAQAE